MIDSANLHLMQTFNFTDDDLKLNRRGELSPAQQEFQTTMYDINHYIADTYSRKEPQMMLWFVLMIVLVLLPIFIFGREPITQVLNSLGIPILPVVIAVAVLSVLLFFYARYSYQQSLQDIREMGGKAKVAKTVSVATGRVKKMRVRVKGRGSRRFRHYAVIHDSNGKVEFRISEEAIDAFDPERVYCVYYLDDSTTLRLLSVEVIG
jgi:hypothetical protein